MYDGLRTNVSLAPARPLAAAPKSAPTPTPAPAPALAPAPATYTAPADAMRFRAKTAMNVKR